ncbi:hypothetical protein [Paludisphaera mucosa]|uniref:Uncharacterized protein n=1 Tax=Paludisphaera mucosa TaxID=3030827 RepID=A0ABT6F4B6_9BACT|nr:hypothetical protein [Paludisphaera mucosa]MDG3002245.1 hypothetical protein [Paludisphaera mucosa]
MLAKNWMMGAIAASVLVLASLSGCGKGEMNPNAAPNVAAPGHSESDGGSGNTPASTSTTTGPGTTAPGAPTGTDGSSGAGPNPR